MAAAAAANLRWLLRPIQPLLDDRNLTDLHINGPGIAFIDRGNGLERIALPYTFDDLEDIAVNSAAFTRQDIGEDAPLVSTRFPDGHRVQIVRPPAIADGQYAFSIRQPKERTWTPEDLEQAGVFAATHARQKKLNPAQDTLMRLHAEKRWRQFLEAAVASGLNIVFSGPVGSGKTHNMRAFTHCIPAHWRVITIEDMQELINLPCENVVNLLYSKGAQSTATVTASDLVEASLRMGMNGLLCQELRDGAAYAYANALKSGHWGMTTTHADSAEDAIPRIAGLVKEHVDGRGLDEADVRCALTRSIDVVAHCVREGNRRRIEQILYDPTQKARYTMHTALAVAAE